MTKRYCLPLAIAFLAGALAAGCTSGGGAAGTPLAGPGTPTARLRNTPASRGPGDFDLLEKSSEPSADIPAYRAILKTGFTGTQDDGPSEWTLEYTYLRSQPAQARWLTIQGTGAADGGDFTWITGELAGTVFSWMGAEEACTAQILPEGASAGVSNPSDMLPDVWGAEKTGSEETVNGIRSVHYRFSENGLGLKDRARASGEFWVAAEGGFLVKYSLQVEGDSRVFDLDTEGKMVWEYSLTADSAADMSLPPEGCPPGRVALPRMTDAADVIELPGKLFYTTASDTGAVADFYAAEMEAAGYSPEEPTFIGEAYSRLGFAKGVWSVGVYISAGPPTKVEIYVEDTRVPEEAPEATPAPATNQDSNPIVAFSRMLYPGESDTSLPSYHIALHHTFPTLDAAKQMVTADYTLSADLQGADKRVQSVRTGGTTKTIDAYLIADKEYKIVGGVAVEGYAGIKIEWVTWPADANSAIGFGSLAYALQGTDTIEGRAVDVVSMDSSKADPAQLEAWQSVMEMLSKRVTEAHGTAWVDRQTGVLLKLVLDYTLEVHDPATKNLIGTGPGHLEIAVTNIGTTVVQLP
jgi:hypothetical protein